MAGRMLFDLKLLNSKQTESLVRKIYDDVASHAFSGWDVERYLDVYLKKSQHEAIRIDTLSEGDRIIAYLLYEVYVVRSAGIDHYVVSYDVASHPEFRREAQKHLIAAFLKSLAFIKFNYRDKNLSIIDTCLNPKTYFVLTKLFPDIYPRCFNSTDHSKDSLLRTVCKITHINYQSKKIVVGSDGGMSILTEATKQYWNTHTNRDIRFFCKQTNLETGLLFYIKLSSLSLIKAFMRYLIGRKFTSKGAKGLCLAEN